VVLLHEFDVRPQIMADEGYGSNGFIIIAKSTFCREGTESNSQ